MGNVPDSDIIHELNNLIHDMRGRKTRHARVVDKSRQPMGDVMQATLRGYTFNASTKYQPPAIEYTQENMAWLVAQYASDRVNPPTSDLARRRKREYSSSPSPDEGMGGHATRKIAVEVTDDDDASDPTLLLDKIIEADMYNHK